MAPTHPIGLHGLIEELGLSVPPPAVRSESGPVSRRSIERPDEFREIYPSRYDCRTFREHLRFGLRYEPLDFRVWQAILVSLPRKEIEEWVREQPTGAFARRAWYLYERLTGRQLDVPDLNRQNYVKLTDAQHQVTIADTVATMSPRHRVQDNSLGSPAYCPLVRTTHRLRQHQGEQYSGGIQNLTSRIDPILFRRAADYLYLRETKSSYAIEGEKPSSNREERFVALLGRAREVDVTSEEGLVAIQRLIVQDKRFEASGWRTIQNYVGHTRSDYSEEVHYPCPKPQDLHELMRGWISLVSRTSPALHSSVDPVVLAACVSFGFVYLHPFEDGNGRLHRFLIHHILTQSGYTPPGVIFPVSAAIHRRLSDYDAVLNAESRRVKAGVEYELDAANQMTVLNETADLYRYPDLTAHAEFLYECIGETLEKDWPEELRFLVTFDAATKAVENIVDLPDNKTRLLVSLLLRNEGQLAKGKRKLFEVLTDEEIETIERGVQAAMETELPV